MSGGLAFSEQKDMNKLRKQSLKGWHVKSFAFMGYRLERGQKEDVTYSIDYRSLHDDEREEYVDFFDSAGWTHVCSEANMHLFKALPNTAPIYSEKESKTEKHNSQGKLINGIAGVLFAIAVVLLAISLLTTGTLQTITKLFFIGVAALTVPAIMTAAAVFYQKLKLRL